MRLNNLHENISLVTHMLTPNEIEYIKTQLSYGNYTPEQIADKYKINSEIIKMAFEKWIGVNSVDKEQAIDEMMSIITNVIPSSLLSKIRNFAMQNEHSWENHKTSPKPDDTDRTIIQDVKSGKRLTGNISEEVNKWGLVSFERKVPQNIIDHNIEANKTNSHKIRINYQDYVVVKEENAELGRIQAKLWNSYSKESHILNGLLFGYPVQSVYKWTSNS